MKPRSPSTDAPEVVVCRHCGAGLFINRNPKTCCPNSGTAPGGRAWRCGRHLVRMSLRELDALRATKEQTLCDRLPCAQHPRQTKVANAS